MLRVAIITKSELDKNDKTNWFEFLALLKKEAIQPMLILPFWDEKADELVDAGIMPICFPFERSDCLAGQRRFVPDLARFFSHIKTDVIISMDGSAIGQIEAAKLAQIPILIQSPSMPEKFYEARKIILSCLKLGHGKVFVPTELAKKQLVKRLDQLELTPVVLSSPFKSCEQVIAKHWAEALRSEKTNQTGIEGDGIDKITLGLSMKAALQNPVLEGRDLDLCYRIPDYPHIPPPSFSKDTETLLIDSSPVQTILSFDSDSLVRLSLIFLIHRRTPCICAMRSAALKVILRSIFNPDFALREIDIPFKDIHNLQWIEISFDPLKDVNREEVIAELSIPEQVKYLLEVKTFIKKNTESSKQATLYIQN